MNIFEKALAAGLDARQIEKARQPMTVVMGQQLESHEAMDRVLLHAAMYDNPGKHIHIPHLGVGLHFPGATETVRLGIVGINKGALCQVS